MTDESRTSIRIYGDTYERLKEQRDDGESVTDVIQRILPDDFDVIERPEDDVVGVHVSKSTGEKVSKMAGENVSANDVIEAYLNKAMTEIDRDVRQTINKDTDTHE